MAKPALVPPIGLPAAMFALIASSTGVPFQPWM